MIDFGAQHVARVAFLKDALYEAFVSEDNGVYLARTGSLVGHISLRTRWAKRAFSKITTGAEELGLGSSTQQRFWTKKVVHDAISSSHNLYSSFLTRLWYFPFNSQLAVPKQSKHTIHHRISSTIGINWGSWLVRYDDYPDLPINLCKRIKPL